MARSITPLALAFAVTVIAGCSAHTHIVGAGAQDAATVQERQWDVLWGLVPINEVRTEDMAEDAADYAIDTEIKFLDGVINIFTGLVSVTSRTVTVTT